MKRESMDFIVFFAFLPFKEISETVPNANTLSLTFALHAENNDADTAIVIISTIILNTFLVLFINPAFSLINSIKLYHIKQQITTKNPLPETAGYFLFLIRKFLVNFLFAFVHRTVHVAFADAFVSGTYDFATV